jgi:hypothetical protein
MGDRTTRESGRIATSAKIRMIPSIPARNADSADPPAGRSDRSGRAGDGGVAHRGQRPSGGVSRIPSRAGSIMPTGREKRSGHRGAVTPTGH